MMWHTYSPLMATLPQQSMRCAPWGKQSLPHHQRTARNWRARSIRLFAFDLTGFQIVMAFDTGIWIAQK